VDNPQALWGSQMSPLDIILQRLDALQTPTWTSVQITPHKIDRCLSGVHNPVHILTLMAQTAPDTVHEEAKIDSDEPACQAEREGNGQSVYPSVQGIDSELIKRAVDLHRSGKSWSKIAIELGKNYSREIKPIKEAVGKQHKIDTTVYRS
jgi:hypothetical protein